MNQNGNNHCLEWSVARYPKKGEEISGDLSFVKDIENRVLLAAVDGLGHGEKALDASKKAIESLKQYSNESLISLVESCHEDLKPTRGVVMSLAVLNSIENTLTWIGVGNVEGMLLRDEDNKLIKSDTILSCRGIMGYKLPLLKASIVSITPGDILLFTTDGVRYGFEENIRSNMSLKTIVQHIASNYRNASDDALILAARYKGLNNT